MNTAIDANRSRDSAAGVPPITLLLRYFTIGGLERVVIALANAFVARGIDTQVVVLHTGKRNALITELDARVELALLSGPEWRRLAALRRLTHGRLVHINFGDGYILPLTRAALAGRVVVVSYMSVYRHKRTWLKNRFDRVWASQAAGIVAVSEAVKEFCVQDVGIPAARVSVIPCVIAPAAALPRSRSSGAMLTAISLASLYPHKNQATLLDGLAAARRQGVDVRLRVVGDGPTMAALYQRCVALGLREAVDWYGAVWRRDIVQPLLASSDVFVSASKFEGLPLSIQEGMSHGLALVLSDIPPHREVAGDAALYFRADEPDTLADRLCSLAANPERRAALERASRERLGRFDLQQCVEDHLAVYRRAAAS